MRKAHEDQVLERFADGEQLDAHHPMSGAA